MKVAFVILGLAMVTIIMLSASQGFGEETNRSFSGKDISPQGQSPNQTENKSVQTMPNEPVGWQTYEDSQDGYKILYPPEWKLSENPVLHRQTGFAASPNDDSNPLEKTLASVYVTNAARTLDPTTLKVQSIPLKEYANEEIQEMTSTKGEPNVLKNEGIVLNGQPAWRLDYIHNYLGVQLNYGITIYVAKEDKLYKLSFLTPPLKVEGMRPIGEKILQTFQFTDKKASSAFESSNLSNQPSNNMPSQSINTEDNQSGIYSRCPVGYHRSSNGDCEKVG